MRTHLPLLDSRMSYQYPPPTSDGRDRGMSQAEHHDHLGMPVPVLPLAGSRHHQIPTMSMNSHIDSDQTLRRSFSIPSSGPAQQSDSEQGQLPAHGEKKRNKLGYHRTSIACSGSKFCSLVFHFTDTQFRPLSSTQDSMHTLTRYTRHVPQLRKVEERLQLSSR